VSTWLAKSIRCIPLAMILVGATQAFAQEAKPDAETLMAIARDIEQLRGDYPALEGFSATKHADTQGLRIDYSYRTHQATQAGGWTAGVPNPDDDGLWFHIDFHAWDSTSQLHTQPMTGPPLCIGDKRVSFLMLEGESIAPVSPAIWPLLRRHGVEDCWMPAPSTGANTLEGLPGPVGAALLALLGGEKPANPGEPYNRTDVIYDENEPQRRIEFWQRRGDTWFVYYGHGGYQWHSHLVGIQYYDNGNAAIVSNVTFPHDYASMAEVRAALADLEFYTRDFCEPVKEPGSCKED
jgi:hypothetical protein